MADPLKPRPPLEAQWQARWLLTGLRAMHGCVVSQALVDRLELAIAEALHEAYSAGRLMPK